MGELPTGRLNTSMLLYQVQLASQHSSSNDHNDNDDMDDKNYNNGDNNENDITMWWPC